MVSKAAEDAQATIKATLDAAREAAMKNVTKAQKEGSKAVEAVQSDAEKNKDAAVSLIVERLLNQ
jgi:vacuolar-type H+-ATPase subunit H